MKHTEHYQLSQFESDDRIQMEDFNADNEKIDAAIAAAADSGLKVMLGTWKGNSETRAITLPVTPKLLIVMGNNGSAASVGICTQECGRFIGSSGSSDSTTHYKLEGNQFIINSSVLFNKTSDTAHYFILY